MTSVRHAGTVWLGLDVHKESIAAGVLRERESTPLVEVIGPEPEAVRRLVRRLSVRPGQVRSCYEAGPSGYGLHLLLTGLGVHCEVIKRLRREVAELRRANEILKAAAAFFGAELDRPSPRS
jgi:transposase-like protein